MIVTLTFNPALDKSTDTPQLLSEKDSQTFTAPTVKKLTTVGNSMVAGLVWMLQKGAGLEDAVRLGIACGTAATVNKGTQLFRKEDTFRFYEWMRNEGSF